PPRTARAPLSLHDALPISRIGLIATGDELVLPGTPLGPDQIVASNSVGLAAMLAPYAEAVTDHGIVTDDAVLLRARLAEAFAARSEEHTSELQSRANLVCR